MARNLIFVAIALVAIVMAGPGDNEKKRPEHKRGGPRGGFHHPLPPFFRNVSDEGKKAIGEVFKNEALTIAQVDTQIAALAEKYGVAAAYKEHKEKEAARHADIKKNSSSIISSIPSVAAKLSAIHENKDQTRKAQREAIEALREENGVAVDAVEFIGRKVGGFGGFGGFGGRRGGGHNGGAGGRGRFGGKHGEKRGQRGGNKDEKKEEKKEEKKVASN